MALSSVLAAAMIASRARSRPALCDVRSSWRRASPDSSSASSFSIRSCSPFTSACRPSFCFFSSSMAVSSAKRRSWSAATSPAMLSRANVRLATAPSILLANSVEASVAHSFTTCEALEASCSSFASPSCRSKAFKLDNCESQASVSFTLLQSEVSVMDLTPREVDNSSTSWPSLSRCRLWPRLVAVASEPFCSSAIKCSRAVRRPCCG
mmetsp:Transcript_79732/g.140716  ORF Transcript_79732/g.140716 Transcript_79732/m.140716 type:complete len:209 (-) Transcript_79732:2306-2932(-)